MLTENIPAVDSLEALPARPALASNRKIAFHAAIAVRERLTSGVFLAVSQTLIHRKSLLRRKELEILHVCAFHKLCELEAKRRQKQTITR